MKGLRNLLHSHALVLSNTPLGSGLRHCLVILVTHSVPLALPRCVCASTASFLALPTTSCRACCANIALLLRVLAPASRPQF